MSLSCASGRLRHRVGEEGVSHIVVAEPLSFYAEWQDRDRPPPSPLRAGLRGEGSGLAVTGPEPSPAPLSFCPEHQSPLHTYTLIQVAYGDPESRWKIRSKRSAECISQNPRSASRSERRQDPPHRLCTCLHHSTCENHAYAATQLVRKRQRANQEASGSLQPTAEPDLLEPPSRRPGNSRGGGGWRGALAGLLAPSLCSRSLSHSVSLFPSPSFSFPPPPRPPSSLPCASGRRFRKRIRSRFRTRKTGAGEEHGQIRIETQTPSRGSERRKEEEAAANGSQCAVQVLIAPVEESLNQRFFFFFFKGDFFRSRQRLKPGPAQLQAPPARKRERRRDREAEEGEEEKVKTLLGEPFAFATKNRGLGRGSWDPAPECLFRAERQGSSASREPVRSPRL
ncbi:uncharacterized protein LOC120606710 [Pteropus medius]|uniref:uncharacterized protein LOC120606710 n=1 Tax=Pteropus vampyrus TaxID=132908 RepID=UPI00196B0ECC|nr:uncharacterized protein LOC120606710 [Pteropus giganteus]